MNTLDAMYKAIEDMLPRLEELDLIDRIKPAEEAASQDDEKLVRYIRIYRHLHPKILAEQRVSRTDIFDALFGDDTVATSIAHRAYNDSYREHYGDVTPYQDGVYDFLCCLKQAGIKLGVVTNRIREFLDHELMAVGWQDIFDITYCGNEAESYKPAPSPLLEVMAKLGVSPGPDIWYVGDSVTDMVTAKEAGIPGVFYNAGLWSQDAIAKMFYDPGRERYYPAALVDDFDQLLDLMIEVSLQGESRCIRASRPERLPARQPPPPRIEPDWHPAVVNLTPPEIILFDWHATLADTLDAMYHAVDDMLPELEEMGLLDKLVAAEDCKSPEDIKLLEHVKAYGKLHPKIKIDRKISRTDIFEVLFGENDVAKRRAHKEFNRHYRNYFGTVLPFEPNIKNMLMGLRELNLKVGVITNRDREFFMHELSVIEDTGWAELFDTCICGDDTERRKPHIDQIEKALQNLHEPIHPNVWYVGDSTTDTIASKTAGITSVFFNGAQWDQPWLSKIFPGNERYPHKPDVVVNDFSEFWALVLTCRKKAAAEKYRARDAS
ncbi:hypothetical protein R50073_14980 [Maricurvus nonylphenolicus]